MLLQGVEGIGAYRGGTSADDPAQAQGSAPPCAAAPRAGASHLLAITLEDYYHNFDTLIDRAHWGRFERRIEQGTRRLLDLLDESGTRATFFALGWVADTLPELIGEVARRGHEVASKGYDQRSPVAMSADELRDDLARAREAIERASGAPVLGYRAPGWLPPYEHDRVAALLAGEGYAYGASVKPFGRAFSGREWAAPRRLVYGARGIWEIPVSSVRIAGLALPVGAANYTRQLPPWLMRRLLARQQAEGPTPLSLYFHAWEFDPDQPQISAASLLARVRYYRNVPQLPDLLRAYLRRYPFTTIASYLAERPDDDLVPSLATARRVHLATTPTPRSTAARPDTAPRAPYRESPRRSAAGAEGAQGPPTPVTLVVPCYNEERTLPYLANTLDSVIAELAPRWALDVVLVDDASTDRTPEVMRELFGGRAGFRIVRHASNLGVARAILTGVREARTEVVASIDCDCTYDPHELGQLLPLLGEGVDVVTGSPYHPEGTVKNVPAWRLALSKSASAIYRVVLRQRIHTYTSCFRAYRRSAVLGLELKHAGFLGVAEMMGRLDLAGCTVVEYPTTLHVRVLGRSKMKVARTVFGHVGLMTELISLRLRGGPGVRRVAAAPAAEGSR